MMLQRTPPRAYLGLDLHRGMVRWCQERLTPCNPAFRFHHHDEHNIGFNPTGRKEGPIPFPVADRSMSLVVAWSVFTHLVQDQIEFYLNEAARCLRPGGTLLSTWFLFEKIGYPMMQEFQNCLYINAIDPTNAVICDRTWLHELLVARRLKVVQAQSPAIRGFQWLLHVAHEDDPRAKVELAPDDAPFGVHRPPTHVPSQKFPSEVE
jgi:SAM-dependent methyltransferase